MNNIQKFLEEEITDFGIDFGHARNCDVQPPNDGEQVCSCGYEQLEGFVKNHDTRLINFVLSEVEKEVEQAKRYDFGGYPDDRYMEEEFDGEYMNYKDISTIINNLRVK